MVNPIKVLMDNLGVFKWWSDLTVEQRYHNLILGIILFGFISRYMGTHEHNEEIAQMKHDTKQEIQGIRERSMLRESNLNGQLNECQTSRLEDGNYFREKYYELKSKIETQ